MSKDALDRELAELENELSRALNWRTLSPELKQELMNRLLELKAKAGTLKEKQHT
jgi:hypothetical protein